MITVRAVLIAGPTASGKSALALALARKARRHRSSMPIPCRSIAICASSPRGRRRRKKRACRTGSMAMSMRRRIIRSARWCRDVGEALDEVARAGPRADPGRRHRALFQGADAAGLPRCRRSRPTIRDQVRARLDERGRRAAACRACARAIRRPRSARCRTTARAFARALEVVLATGPLAVRLAPRRPAAADRSRAIAAKVFLTCERERLVARIEARFDAMLEAGALEEVRALAARKLDPTLPAMKAHGVPWLIRHLNGEISLRRRGRQAP